ncbi:hypothetical protein COV16_06410 [Candidatus Woesearchaeota archaeon CG10_big_fil_rev_8_21_14_0_10_34_8]|nr:MAG: hypothetical protein COV16_06410 [Candidatus Woesearchaeota archaeon CG10_big_fil_rev_8_21_14_0_10_34_8]
MKLKEIFTAKRVLFILLFLGLVLIGKKINFSPIIGTDNQFFTLYQFFGPIAGGFLGPVFGIVSVFGAELANFFIAGKTFTAINLLRLTPMLFAAYYFGTRKKTIGLVVPILAMIAFVLNPIGREAWLYAMYWWIPVVVVILPKKYSSNLFLKSLGATFTAHAIGSVAWVWSVPMGADQWLALIPVVAYERLLFAVGITGSYVIMNTVLDVIVDKWNVSEEILNIDKRYLVLKRLFAKNG